MSLQRHHLLFSISSMLLCACAGAELERPPGPPAQDMGVNPTLDMMIPGQDLGGVDLDASPDLSPGEEMGQNISDMEQNVSDMEQNVSDMSADMVVADMAPQDMGGVMCMPACGATEECRMGQCINLCAQRVCGEVMRTGGGVVSCGSCGSGEVCDDAGRCQAACQSASAECGELAWSGATAQCGPCVAPQTCYKNSCMGGTSSGFRSVAGGEDHTCATRAGGQVLCWGDNRVGQLGLGTIGGAERRQPTPVGGLTSVQSVSAFRRHTCALDASGRLWCWGFNSEGQLGDGSVMDSATPRQVSMPGLTVIEAAASGVHTCVRVQDGTLRCWGGNPQGQLGVGDLMSSYQPLLTSFINNAAQLSAGNAHTCVAERDGVAWCWGYNGFAGKFGRLGQGESAGGINALTRPGQVANLQSEHVRQLASGNGHTCALLQSGGVRCWGDNTFGQLGNNGGVQSTSPVVVQGINHAIEVASGFEHSCAVLADRTVRCWGNNSDGQLGNGTTNVSRVPVAVQGLDEVVSIGLGYYHSCAVRRNGTMLCWGRNDRGQLGDNTVVNRSTPVFVQ